MTLCALLFFPWVEPRETLSGFMGRYRQASLTCRCFAALIDILHWWEPNHCYVTWRLEDAMRKSLYP